MSVFKFSISLAFLLTIAFGAFSQENTFTVIRADKAYADHEYLRAARLYEVVMHYHKVPPGIPVKLATCYRSLNDYANAARWYQKITDQFPANGQDWVYYGDALKSLGMYAQAKIAYRHAPDSLYNLVLDRVVGCDSALAWMDEPSPYDVTNLATVNTSHSDWGAIWYTSESIVFTSDSLRPDALFHNKGGNAKEQKLTTNSFQKIYVTDGGALDSATAIKGFSPVINDNIYHDGAVTFNPTGDTAYFSLTNPGKKNDPIDKFKFKDGKKINTATVLHLELWWTAKDSSGGWGPAHAFPYNNAAKYSLGQAALSPDGQTLYYASDMPGGHGKTDIWYSDRKADGSWSAPVNCGPLVNSGEEEAFPIVGTDGALYFASKGHVGMGGYDIFKATGAKNNWDTVINLRYPVNSSGDDFYFTMKDSANGFLSSNRPGGKGSDDIYVFEKSRLLTHIMTRPDSPLAQGPPGESIALAEPRPVVKPAPSPFLFRKGSKGKHPSPDDGGGSDGDTPDTLSRYIVLKTLVVDYLSGEPMAGAAVTIAVDKQRVPAPVTTTAAGLIYRTLARGSSFVDSATKTGYTDDKLSQSTADMGPADTLSVTLRLEKEPETGDLFVLNKIYFDFNRWNIRKDASIELDRLVAYMRRFPNITIDLSAHTDSRGDDDYNQTLSENRAESAREYLVNHGIHLHRIITHGFGESMLVNGCKNDVPCTEAEHQANRRIEVKVLELD